jgi:hypothetical protein
MKAKKFFIIILLLALIASFSYRIDLTRSPHELIGELMYFPSGIAVKAVSMGFYAPLADFVWLRFIQYYGEHRLTDKKFELMFHILDILTTLDKHFTYAYTLGAFMLTHDAKRPDQARKLLKKGMNSVPDDWRHPYIYGFIHYVFIKDYKTAQVYFRLSAQKPGAPEMCRRWAAYTTYFKLGDRRASLAMWIDFYNTTENPEEKQLADIYIKRIKMEIDLELLNEKLHEFTTIHGFTPKSLQRLVNSGLLDSIPSEPHGEMYKIRNDTVYSTWRDSL